jgi:hypothetical protein
LNFRNIIVAVAICLLFVVYLIIGCAERKTQAQRIFPQATRIPDRIMLTWADNPATSQAVTWRTDSTVTVALAEIAIADPSPKFAEHAQQHTAETTALLTDYGTVHFHSVKFSSLTPETIYAYRVGDGEVWSEWVQFTTASEEQKPFSFIYFGDAQNNILSMWSRTIRTAFTDAPKASFIIHAGDLVNRANRDIEWAEWFKAGGWIHAKIPGIATPGNHEYAKDEEGNRHLSNYWLPQFTLPDNGVDGLPESTYYLDYQGTRIISLNSNEQLELQQQWLAKVLEDNPNRWTILTFHHPVFSSAKGRSNDKLRELWKPLFDKHKVDIVLQGHDHSYARGMNLPKGQNRQEINSGTMYVVSVSGPKMYELTSERWMDRGAENTQLYQIINVSHDKLQYKAYAATGELYDAFTLLKQENAANLLQEDLPVNLPERTMETSLKTN